MKPYQITASIIPQIHTEFFIYLHLPSIKINITESEYFIIAPQATRDASKI